MHMLLRAPQIARQMAGLWFDHRQALDEVALPYLDYLIEGVLETKPMSKWELQSRLCEMVPIVTPGTVSRMLDLRFGTTSGERLQARKAAWTD